MFGKWKFLFAWVLALSVFFQSSVLATDEEERRPWQLKITHDNTSLGDTETDVYSSADEIELKGGFGGYETEIEMDIEERDLDELELEAILRKYVGRFLTLGGGAVYKNQSAYAALAALYYFPGRLKLEGYVRHDGRAVVKLSKVFLIGEKFDLKLEPQLKSVEEMALENLAASHSLLDWSFKMEFYYNHSEKFSVGTNYRRGNNQQNSAGIGFKVRF